MEIQFTARKCALRGSILSIATIASVVASTLARDERLEAPSTPLERLIGRMQYLRLDDPREFPMKLRSVLLDPYTFFRGRADFFYAFCREECSDWIGDRRCWVRLHGDVHIGNVGVYQSTGEPGKDLRFGLVDFDEAIDGPFQLDLLRALTSIRFAARELQVPTNEESLRNAARQLTDGYRDSVSGRSTYDDVVSGSPAVQALFKKAADISERKFLAGYVNPETTRFRRARVKNNKVKDLMDAIDADAREGIVRGLREYAASLPQSQKSQYFPVTDDLGDRVLDVVRWTRIGSSGSQGLHKYLVVLKPPQGETTKLLMLELKQEPVAAAAATGGLHCAAGVDRAAEVADAFVTLLSNPPRLTGHAVVGDRGYLIVAKDPWNEEFEPNDFARNSPPNSLNEMALLLGQAIGLAHREWMLHSNSGTTVGDIVDGLKAAEEKLLIRSATIEQLVGKEFDALKSDPTIKPYVESAEALIESRAHISD